MVVLVTVMEKINGDDDPLLSIVLDDLGVAFEQIEYHYFEDEDYTRIYLKDDTKTHQSTR